MSQSSTPHLAAAARHEQAADNHDRAARFWDDQGQPRRAELQREMAAYERHGARLELRWEQLAVEDQTSTRAATVGSARTRVRESAGHLASCLAETATLLEECARLADEQSQRPDVGTERAAREAGVADRARQAAEQARAQAAEWLRLAEGSRS